MNAKFFATPMAFVKSLTTAVSRALTAKSFRAWIHWTASVIIVVTGVFFYISAARSITGWSLMPLHTFFFYPLTWFVIIGVSIFASTLALVTVGYQDGFDNIPVISPLYIAKETITFPLWFPKEVYRILRS